MADLTDSPQKQIRDLEEQISELQEGKYKEGDESEAQKLKRLILTFKKKYQRALQELQSKEKVQQDQDHVTLRKYQEMEEENCSLVAQQNSLKALLQKQEQLNMELSRKLEARGEEGGATTPEANNWFREKQKELQYEIARLKGEVRLAREAAQQLQLKLEASASTIEELERENVDYREERAKLEEMREQAHDDVDDLRYQCNLAQQARAGLEQQIAELKEALQEGSAGREAERSYAPPGDNEIQRENLELKKQQEMHKHRIEKLMQVIQERDRRINDLKRYEFSFRKVSDINMQMEKEVANHKVQLDALKLQNKELHASLEETQFHGKQLEKAIELLREKGEEAELNAGSLQRECQEALSRSEQLEAERNSLQAALEKVQTQFSETFARNSELEQELELLRSQMNRLRQEYSSKGEMLSGKEERLSQFEQQLAELASDKKRLEADVRVKDGKLAEMTGELREMKETMVKGLREANEIKQYYHHLLQEKSAAMQKHSQMQVHIQELNEKIRLQEREREEALRRLEEADKEKGRFDALMAQEKQKHERFRAEIKEREDNLSSFSEQIRSLQGKVKKTEDALRERDSSLVEAQQHLAKKVREASRLSELLDEQQRQISRLQEDLGSAKAKASESLAHMESHLEQQKKLKEQIGAWEEKYFRAHEKLQELEAQNRELKKVEEKHLQMQSLLSNLGNVIGAPVGITQPRGMLPEEVRPPVPPASRTPPKVKKKNDLFPEEPSVEQKPSPPPQKKIPEQGSLFEPMDKPPGYKNDLFES